MACGLCGGPLVLLGKLGDRKHYRCRNCGMGWSKPAKPKQTKRPKR
jgi:hypothetical protein